MRFSVTIQFQGHSFLIYDSVNRDKLTRSLMIGNMKTPGEVGDVAQV